MTKICICVPCFNESMRLAYFIAQIKEAFKNRPAVAASIWFLNDGSSQDDTQKMRHLVESTSLPGVQLEFVHFQLNRGKGAVLRDGFKRALAQDFDFIGFCDGDGATSMTEMLKILSAFSVNPQVGVIVGSRWKALGYQVKRSLKRHLSGRIFATLLSNLFEIPVYDSQCGAKIFRRQVLSLDLLDYCYDQKWLFDPQLIIVLYKAGVQILEFPVNWEDQAGSKISLLKDSWRMFWGLWGFRKYLIANPPTQISITTSLKG